MPATGLKIVGMGACLPWCSTGVGNVDPGGPVSLQSFSSSISSSFQNSLKTSGHQGYEFLEF